MTTRRAVIKGGCAAAAMLAIPATIPATAHAGLGRDRAPRITCSHSGCRHFRPDTIEPGVCVLSLAGVVAYPDEVLP
jgi:hypothetical protein